MEPILESDARAVEAKALAMEGFAKMARTITLPYDAMAYGRRLKKLGLEIADLGEAITKTAAMVQQAEVFRANNGRE